VVSGELDERLQRLKDELDDHARIARYLGLDFERPRADVVGRRSASDR
jgi:hypothetical protein